jgi:hypothetical protein
MKSTKALPPLYTYFMLSVRRLRSIIGIYSKLEHALWMDTAGTWRRMRIQARKWGLIRKYAVRM